MKKIEICPRCGLPKLPYDDVGESRSACHCEDDDFPDETFDDADDVD